MVVNEVEHFPYLYLRRPTTWSLILRFALGKFPVRKKWAGKHTPRLSSNAKSVFKDIYQKIPNNSEFQDPEIS